MFPGTQVIANYDDPIASMDDKESNDIAFNQKQPAYNINTGNLRDLTKTRSSRAKESAYPSARDLMQFGELHYLKKSYSRAKRAYLNALKQDSGLVDAWRRLITISAIEHDFRATENYFHELLELTKHHPDYEYDYIIFRMTRVRTHKGASELENRIKKLIDLHPDYIKFKTALGAIILTYENDVEQAKSVLEEAYKLDSHDIHTLNNLGICYHRLGENPKARSLFQKAVDEESRYLPGYENSAKTYMDDRHSNEAIDWLEKAISLNLELSPVWSNNYAFLLIQLDRTEEAIQWIQKELQTKQSYALFNNLGVSYSQIEEKNLATEAYLKSINLVIDEAQRGIEHEDSAYNAFYNVLELLIKEGENAQDSENISKELLKLDPSNIKGLFYLGSAKTKLRKFDEAEPLLRKVIERNNKVEGAYIDLTFILASVRKQYTEPIAILEEAVGRGMHHPYTINNLAFAYLKSGQIKKAEELIQKDNHKTGDNSSFIATEGLLAYYQGRYEDGNKLYAEAVNKIKDSDKKLAQQVWKYEQAHYWFAHKNYLKAKEFLDEATLLGTDYYIYDDIQSLRKKLKSVKREN